MRPCARSLRTVTRVPRILSRSSIRPAASSSDASGWTSRARRRRRRTGCRRCPRRRTPAGWLPAPAHSIQHRVPVALQRDIRTHSSGLEDAGIGFGTGPLTPRLELGDAGLPDAGTTRQLTLRQTGLGPSVPNGLCNHHAATLTAPGRLCEDCVDLCGRGGRTQSRLNGDDTPHFWPVLPGVSQSALDYVPSPDVAAKHPSTLQASARTLSE